MVRISSLRSVTSFPLLMLFLAHIPNHFGPVPRGVVAAFWVSMVVFAWAFHRFAARDFA